MSISGALGEIDKALALLRPIARNDSDPDGNAATVKAACVKLVKVQGVLETVSESIGGAALKIENLT